MPGFIGLPELLLLGIVVLLLFGPKRLPEFGKSLGNGLREFKDSVGGSGSSKDDTSTKVAEISAPTVATSAPASVPMETREPVEQVDTTSSNGAATS